MQETSSFGVVLLGKLCYLIILFLIMNLITSQAILFQPTSQDQQARANFPGVSRELSSFCAARPSLPIDLASMVIHVKRNVSFNYKLYLFSPDHVFQTGQVIPRDDFRVHSFPVKLKSIGEFWPATVPTFAYKNSKPESLYSVPSETFKLKRFMRPVPLDPTINKPPEKPTGRGPFSAKKKVAPRRHSRVALPEDAHGDALPGDLEASPASSQDEEENLNKLIQFDRDDQVSISRRAIYAEHREYLAESSPINGDDLSLLLTGKKGKFLGDLIVPVGSFSSFHVNITYLARKDFGQTEPQIIRIQVEPNQFKVVNLQIINNGSSLSYPSNEDYNFLNHKLLRDPNTRITSINQIYEDWITRNFYTIVYIQRKLEEEISVPTRTESEDEEENGSNSSQETTTRTTIVNDRLVFRGSSTSLLGADQLDYSVKAAAFITEKNGLHYYLEFLTSGKFYLAAIDWTKRPFKIIDSRHFPMKATKTLLDNEELLLCPPAVCYSNQPIDEVISFGRLPLSSKVQRDAAILAASSAFHHSSKSGSIVWQANKNNIKQLNENDLALFKSSIVIMTNETSIKRPVTNQTSDLMRESRDASDNLTDQSYNAQHLFAENISLDNVIEEIRSASGQLQTRLHLRDWVWILSRTQTVSGRAPIGKQAAGLLPVVVTTSIPTITTNTLTSHSSLVGNDNKQQQVSPIGMASNGKFDFRYELARRNDIKVKPDTYGYVLTGHDIDASYRVYNELYLITANHLITINYTMAEATSVSSHPIGDEFLGLDSNLLDPITGAFYDRYNNQIFFFKGDRYIGYDYATKKPLDEFVLQETTNYNGGSLHMDLASQDQSMAAAPLVSSLPVVDILGVQHQVDGVYHDFSTDLVYIFTGMKFYTFQASEFKNGTFSKQDSQTLPQMYCINENFLHGCNFDEAFPNPCQNDETSKLQLGKSGKLKLADGDSDDSRFANDLMMINAKRMNFSEEQQMKLRSIATKSGLLNFLVENSLLNNGPARALVNATPIFNEYQPQEKIVFYMLAALVALTVLLVLVMIVVLTNWTRLRFFNDEQQRTNQEQQQHKEANQMSDPQIHHYLSNQQQQQHHHHHHRHARRARSNSGRNVNTGRTVVKTSGVPIGVMVSKTRRHGEVIDNSAL